MTTKHPDTTADTTTVTDLTTDTRKQRAGAVGGRSVGASTLELNRRGSELDSTQIVENEDSREQGRVLRVVRPDLLSEPSAHPGADDTTPTGPAIQVEPVGEDETSEPAHAADVADGSSGLSAADLVPSWARSWDAFAGLVRERCTRAGVVTVFHAQRLPVYWCRLSVRSPRTVARMVRALWDWTTDHKGSTARATLAYGPMGGSEAIAFDRITHAHRRSQGLRAGFVAVTTLILTLVLAGVWAGLPGWRDRAGLGVLGVLLPVLGAFSRDPKARRVVDSIRYVGNTVPPLSTELIAAALDALGIAQLSRGLKEHGIQLVNPIHRDGPGYRVDVDLPSVPASAVMERRDKLAAGLRRPLGCVWPQADPDAHEARLILWVGDKAPNKAKPRAWALAAKGKVDLFEAFPVGTNPQGRPVTLTLMFASMVIGAIPRMGKTFAMRVILLAAALDPHAELHVYDLKGGGDWRPMGPVSHRFRIGDEDEDIAYLAADTAELKAEMVRRYKVVRGLPETVCPEGKVTPQLAAQKGLRLHPIVLAIDETQKGFEDEQYGKQIEADITDLVKRGPAVGIIVILATQRPDAKSIPVGISANAVLRFCLKVMAWQANDMVLGSGAYKAGINATMFVRSDRGTGYLVGEGDEPQIVTFGFVDAPTAKTIVARARAARELAGTITGYAADLDAEPGEQDPTPTLLDDLVHVLPVTEPKAWSDVLLERLTAYRPETYGGWSTVDLGNAASAYGINTVQIGRREAGKVVNRKGIDRAHILTAITERDSKRDA